MTKYIMTIALIISYTTQSWTNNHFVLISAPGSGKGTFSQYCVNKYEYEQICPGDIFRNEIALGTELGKQIQPIVDRGEYVDENIVCQLMEKYISDALINDKLFILDGFPRSTFSFNFLCSLLKKYNIEDKVCFIQFISPDETCIERILNRIICTNCFMVYSQKNTEINICKKCQSNLSKRKADTYSIAKKRLKYFHENIELIMSLAEQTYPTKKIISDYTINNMEEQYENLFFNN